MINPAELIELVVCHLRNISDLVKEVGSDKDRIYAYHDRYPDQVSLVLAIHRMPSPSIMVAWAGTGPAQSGDFQVWSHQINVFLRAGQEDEDLAVPHSYYKLYRLIVKGVPEGEEQPLIYKDLHPSCFPAELPMIQRQTDAEGLDYFEIPLSFKENGDDV